MMEAYLDNSATTRCSDRAFALMQKVLLEDYGNPSSLHMKGVEAELLCESGKRKDRKDIESDGKRDHLYVRRHGVNNLAILGTAFANRRAGNRIITTAVEHASVANPMKFLEEEGFEVIYLPVDENGVISLKDLEEALSEQTILVSLMHVNNEIGAVEPVEEAAALVHEKCPKALVHVDAIQSYGKFRIYPKKSGIDLLSVSGHKIHGPKGSGFYM